MGEKKTLRTLEVNVYPQPDGRTFHLYVGEMLLAVMKSEEDGTFSGKGYDLGQPLTLEEAAAWALMKEGYTVWDNVLGAKVGDANSMREQGLL